MPEVEELLKQGERHLYQASLKYRMQQQNATGGTSLSLEKNG